MMEKAQTAVKAGKGRYFKAPVFAVAPMIDGVETSKKLSENNGGKILVANL